MKNLLKNLIGKKEGVTPPSTELKTFEFAFVTDDKRLKDSPLERGDLVFVMSEKDVRCSSNDPYLYRKLMVVAMCSQDGLPLIPKSENDYKVYIIDPRSLQLVVGNLAKDLKENIKNVYGG